MNPDIKSLNYDELSSALKDCGYPSFRADQVYSWLHKQKVDSFDEMTNISSSMREELKNRFSLPGCVIERKQVSAQDGTVKYLFRLFDDEFVESVVMKYKYGHTICVSSQVGCKMGCRFCASTLAGFKRGLLPSEILSQIYTAEKDMGIKISHIVLMGMGEPMDNFDNVMKFIELAVDEKGLNISGRNISLSTCGIVPGIYSLLEKHLQLTLSVSLHAPNDALRNEIMPVNRKYNVDTLLKACRDYSSSTSRRISFEYSMLRGINDTDECALELAEKLKGILCHVNLIPVNEVKESPFKPSTPQRIKAFSAVLEKRGIPVTVRRKLGSDIDASCGQLRRKVKESIEESPKGCDRV